jgi:glycerol-3-phosphate cytidylyltransferase
MKFIRKLLKLIRRILHGDVMRVLNDDVMRTLNENVMREISLLNAELQYIKSGIAVSNDRARYMWETFARREDLSAYANVFFDPKDCRKPRGLVLKIQLLNEYLLKNLSEICEKLDIKFWLHGGTLLGAARHGGYVPWDDDVDLGIMREDLEKIKDYLKDMDTDFTVRKFFFIPRFYSYQERFVFKDKDIPVCLDLFVYDNCDIGDNKDAIWNDYLNERELIKQQLIKTGITSNFADGIDNPDDEEIVLDIIGNFIKKHREQEKTDGIAFSIEQGVSHFPRIYKNDFIFPLVKLKFENGEYYAPNKYVEYLTNQYGDWERLPIDIGAAKHIYNYTPEHIKKVSALVEELGLQKPRVGYSAGAFDMFHIGHLNLLRKSRENCDRLIVGITTDELVTQTKNRHPIIPFEERAAIVRACGYVDEVVAQDDLDKVNAWEKFQYDVLFSGDDWKGNPRWVEYEKRLEAKGSNIKVVYFPYTQSVSSSKLAKIINEYEE